MNVSASQARLSTPVDASHSAGAPSYPRELNDRLGDDYKQACGAGIHVLAALAHVSPAVHVALAVGGHGVTDLACTDAAPVQVGER